MKISRDDVAARAGVGSGTVSRTFNKPHSVSPRTREKVFAAAEALGYVPNKQASLLRRNDNGTILVAEDLSFNEYRTWRNHSWMWASMERALTTWFDSSPFSMRRLSVNRPSELTSILEREPWAAVLTLNMEKDRYRQIIDKSGIPAITAAGHGIATRRNAVAPDDARGAEQLATHLKERGHQRPIMVTLDLEEFPQRRQRHEGFQRILPFQEVISLQKGTCKAASLREQVLDSLQRTNPDVVFVHSSTLAAKVLYILMDAGHRPGETISLVSYDNAHWLSHLPIGLTTVDNRIGDVVTTALDLLHEDISREEVGSFPTLRLEPQLVVRDSVVDWKATGSTV